MTITTPGDSYQLVRLDQLRECPFNPRKHYDARKLEELVTSVRQVGIIEPLIVRPVPGATEIVAGARRFRAAKLAGLELVPVLERQLTDVQVLELMIVENNQRDDVHPLEEGEGYRALMNADHAYTPEAIAAKVGKSTSYIYQRLKLAQLIPAAKKAFTENRITAAHAIRLARLTAVQQKTALPECFYRLFQVVGEDEEHSEPAPVSQLDRWIESHDKVDLQSPDVEHYFPELAGEVDIALQKNETGRLLELSESFRPGAELGTKDHGALGHHRWSAITGTKNRCAHLERGVVVHGGPVRILEVCATKGCPKHFPERKNASGAHQQTQARDRVRDAERAREQNRQTEIRHAFGKALSDAIDQKAGQCKKLDGRILSIAAKYVFRTRSLTLAGLPAALIREATRDLGSWSVDPLSKIAKALGIDPKPLQAAAEAKFPNKVEKKAEKGKEPAA